MFSGFAYFQESPAPAPTGLTYGRWVGGRNASGTLNRAAWSNDGISGWTLATTPLTANYNSVAFSPDLGLFVAVSDSSVTNNIMSSTNGVTWTARSKATTTALQGVEWCSWLQKFAACSAIGTVFESTDGASWTCVFTASTGGATGAVNVSTYRPFAGETADAGFIYGIIAWTGNAAPYNVYFLYSSDLKTFTYSNNIFSGQGTLGRSIAYSKALDRYIVANQGNPDRISFGSTESSGWGWYFQSNSGGGVPAGNLRLANNFANGLFHFGNYSGANYTIPIAYSSTGLTGSWTYSTLASSAYTINTIAYSAELGIWIATNNNGTNCLSSTNGTTWTSRTAQATIRGQVFGPGIRTTGYKQGAGIT